MLGECTYILSQLDMMLTLLDKLVLIFQLQESEVLVSYKPQCYALIVHTITKKTYMTNQGIEQYYNLVNAVEH
jgi:hypothetical protein